MSLQTRDRLLVLAAAVAVFFTALGGSYLWDEDEPKNAECAREMFEAGEWIVPQYNYQLRTDKPILLYWLMLASYSLFGVSEFAARFPSALLAVGTTLLTFGIGARLYGKRAGLWSGLALAGCVMFAAAGRASTPDSTLVFFTTLSMYAFVRLGGVERGTVSRGGFALVYAAMSLAVLTKGPVGVVLPGAILTTFLWFRNASGSRGLLRRAAATVAAMRPLVGLAVLSAVAAPWYVWVAVRTEGAWPAGFFGYHNFTRFTTAVETHGGPFFYYLIVVILGFFPWSTFLPAAAYELVRRLRFGDDAATRHVDLLPICWSGAYLLFFTVSRTKLPGYVLPCFPALALITGRLFDAWQRQADEARAWRVWLRAAIIWTGICGGLLAIGFPIVAPYLLIDSWWVGLVGLTLVVASAIAIWCERGRPQWVPAIFAVGAVAFTVSLAAFAAGTLSQHATTPQVLAAARDRMGDEVRLIGFQHSEPTLNFYSKQEVPVVGTAEELHAALARFPNACIVTRDAQLAELVQALGGEPQIFFRHRRFLRTRGDILLALPPATATAQSGHPLRR